MSSLSADQQRAAYAARCLDRVPDAEMAEYASRIRSVPALLLSSGVGQAIAVLSSKPDTAPIARDLIAWLGRAPGIPWGVTDIALPDRLSHPTTGIAAWSRASEEALAIAGWLKRLAEARRGAEKRA